METLRSEQNLTLGLVYGSIAAVLGALIWAAITVSTQYQIGYMAVAIGFMVGFAVRKGGKGIDKIFGISGAVLSLLGCLAGNFLSIVGYVADAEGLGYFDTLSQINYSVMPSLMVETFRPLDLLFYGIAIYEGYRFSFRQLTDEEISANS